MDMFVARIGSHNISSHIVNGCYRAESFAVNISVNTKVEAETAAACLSLVASYLQDVGPPKHRSR